MLAGRRPYSARQTVALVFRVSASRLYGIWPAVRARAQGCAGYVDRRPDHRTLPLMKARDRPGMAVPRHDPGRQRECGLRAAVDSRVLPALTEIQRRQDPAELCDRVERRAGHQSRRDPSVGMSRRLERFARRLRRRRPGRRPSNGVRRRGRRCGSRLPSRTRAREGLNAVGSWVEEPVRLRCPPDAASVRGAAQRHLQRAVRVCAVSVGDVRCRRFANQFLAIGAS
jgi:hypothetical protein